MRVEAFIIHLARATQRRKQVERLRQVLPIQTHVVDAVDGEMLSDQEIGAVYKRHIHRPRYPFELRKAEVACFLSHRKAWREIVTRGLDGGLVIEDDVEIDEALFPDVLAVALDNLRHGDFIRFPWRNGRDRGRELVAIGGVSLCEPNRLGLGMLMQLVGRNAAAELLMSTQTFDRPVDTLIQLNGVPCGRVLAIHPVAIDHIDEPLGGTTIQKKSKPLSETLSREVKRSLYKLRLRIGR